MILLVVVVQAFKLLVFRITQNSELKLFFHLYIQRVFYAQSIPVACGLVYVVLAPVDKTTQWQQSRHHQHCQPAGGRPRAPVSAQVTIGTNWVVLGGPSQTTECLPTSWASEVVYSGVQCPQKYTSACQGTDSHSEVTCCPKYVRLSKRLLRHRPPDEVLTGHLHGSKASTALPASTQSLQKTTVPCFDVHLRGMATQHSTYPTLNLTGALLSKY